MTTFISKPAIGAADRPCSAIVPVFDGVRYAEPVDEPLDLNTVVIPHAPGSVTRTSIGVVSIQTPDPREGRDPTGRDQYTREYMERIEREMRAGYGGNHL